MIQHDGRCCRYATVNRPPSRPGRSLQTLGRSDSVAVACSFNNAAPVACSETTAAAARSPSRAAARRGGSRTCCQADLVAVLHLVHVREAGRATYSRRTEASPRACRSDFGDGDFSCGAAEAYVPVGSSSTEPAARVRMLEAKGTTPGHSSELRSTRARQSWVVRGCARARLGPRQALTAEL